MPEHLNKLLSNQAEIKENFKKTIEMEKESAKKELQTYMGEIQKTFAHCLTEIDQC